MVNGIVSLISLYDILLLVYRKATDFCILILYPATLLNSLMSSSSFLVASLGFSMYSIMASANNDHFTCSFPVWILFIYTSSLNGVVRISKTTLIKVSRMGILVFFLILKGMLSAFHDWVWWSGNPTPGHISRKNSNSKRCMWGGTKMAE